MLSLLPHKREGGGGGEAAAAAAAAAQGASGAAPRYCGKSVMMFGGCEPSFDHERERNNQHTAVLGVKEVGVWEPKDGCEKIVDWGVVCAAV